MHPIGAENFPQNNRIIPPSKNPPHGGFFLFSCEFFLILCLIFIRFFPIMKPIDQALSPIAKSYSYCADPLLDLREAAEKKENAGLCVSCYYRIFENVPQDNHAPMHHLRQWLEDHLLVVARDANAQEIERVPFRLWDQTLEDFCRRMIEEFRFNRIYQQDSIELSFEFADTCMHPA